MTSIVTLISEILGIYMWVIIASAVLSWLLAFNVINARNGVVMTLWNVLNNLTEPVLGPIRRRLPNLGGIDLSPVILILAIILVRDILCRNLGPCSWVV